MRIDTSIKVTGQGSTLAALDVLRNFIDEDRIRDHYLGGGGADMGGEPPHGGGAAIDDDDWKLVPQVHPGECKRCRRNTDWKRVPLHAHCRCTVTWEREREYD